MTLGSRLYEFFDRTTKRSDTKGQPADSPASVFDPLLYSLETPKPQQIVFGGLNCFSGWIVYLGAKVVAALEVGQADNSFGPFSVNLPRQDVAMHIPAVPAGKTCGFSFEILLQDAEPLVFTVVYEDGSREDLFCYELQSLKQQQEQWRGWKEQLADLPQPSCELVYLTQGITNITEYQNSILPAVSTMQNYLAVAGVSLENLRNLLDFGCGSGRLLLGWHIMRPDVVCCGTDINQRLVGWAQRYLPPAMQFDNGCLLPPTRYATDSFDLIYAISVFTHLNIQIQQQWIAEFCRILRPGGYLLVTLHGPLYAHRAFHDAPDMLQAFVGNGYAAIGDEEGSNSLATFHACAFAEQLFKGFRLLAYHPQGHLGEQRIIFPVAHSQDVYVFQRIGG